MGRRPDVGSKRNSVQTDEALKIASGRTGGRRGKKWRRTRQDAAPAYKTPD